MKILLIGKTGQLGGDILSNGSANEIFAPGRDILDIENPGTVSETMAGFKPDVVINTAAFHNVPLCEKEHERAFRINCIAVRDLALACQKTGALFMTFSTDYVFDGAQNMPYDEDDVPAPLQIYGISKLAGEHAALSIYPEKTIVIRTCGLYGRSGAGSRGGNFVDKRINDAKTSKYLEMGADQTVCPTYTEDLSMAVLSLLELKGTPAGIYHLVNQGQCTWYEFTKTIFEVMKMQVEVVPVDRGGREGDMRRPLYSALKNTRAKALGIELPHWRGALSRYLRAKYPRFDYE